MRWILHRRSAPRPGADAYLTLTANTEISLAQTLEKLGDPINAQTHYRQALLADPGNGTAALALGNLLKESGHKGDAFVVYLADFIRVDVGVCFDVFLEGVIRPRSFPQPS